MNIVYENTVRAIRQKAKFHGPVDVYGNNRSDCSTMVVATKESKAWICIFVYGHDKLPLVCHYMTDPTLIQKVLEMTYR